MENRLGLTGRTLRFTSLAAVAALAMVGCGGKKVTNTVQGPSASGSPAAPPPPCPLTGRTPAGGSFPNRPALGIKVENSPDARPQSGLDTADIVWETPVEGGITRFLVVYHCQDAARVEPVRSARIQDVDILSQLNKPLFGDAGGSPPTEAALNAAMAAGKLVRLSYSGAGYHRDPSRGNGVHSLFTNTQELYARPDARGGGIPKPLFTYSASPAPGGPGGAVHVNFSQYSNVFWRWNQAAGAYQRYYGTAPANGSNGAIISTQNVVVQSVAVTMSSFIEDPSGSHQPIATLTGTGPALVCRAGSCVTGTWTRPSASDVTRYVDGSGAAIALTPGTTWVELAPSSVTGPGPIPVAQVAAAAQ